MDMLTSIGNTPLIHLKKSLQRSGSEYLRKSGNA